MPDENEDDYAGTQPTTTSITPLRTTTYQPTFTTTLLQKNLYYALQMTGNDIDILDNTDNLVTFLDQFNISYPNDELASKTYDYNTSEITISRCQTIDNISNSVNCQDMSLYMILVENLHQFETVIWSYDSLQNYEDNKTDYVYIIEDSDPTKKLIADFNQKVVGNYILYYITLPTSGNVYYYLKNKTN